MKIRAAVLHNVGAARPYAQSRPLSVEEIDLEGPGNDEVLVRIAAAGLCHSDLSVINGDRPRPVPMALGHEAVGIVEELGSEVRDLAVGDHVVIVFVPSCGHCMPCAEGRPALCEPGAKANTQGTLLSGAHRLRRNDTNIHHHLGVSAFAEYATVSRRSLVKIDPDIPIDVAALFGCAALTGVGAVVNTAKVPAGATVAVIGLGGVGLAALLGAVAVGAARVIAIGRNSARLAFAQSLGATEVFSCDSETIGEEVRAATGGGVDYAFEFAGSVSAMQLAYKITRRGGTTVIGGLPPPSASFSCTQVGLVAEERTIKGSYIGTCVPSRDVPRYLSLYRTGRMPIDRLLTHRLKLDQINSGFDELHEGRAIRQVVMFS